MTRRAIYIVALAVAAFGAATAFGADVIESFEAVRKLPRDAASEVLEKLAGGLSTDGIADSMSITDNAVKKHLKSIFAKLGVSDRVNAVTEAIRRGFVRR